MTLARNALCFGCKTTLFICFVIVQSGCTSSTTIRSSAQPNLIINPLASDQIEVEYARVAADLEKKTIAGILVRGASQEDKEVTVLDYQNRYKRDAEPSGATNLITTITGSLLWLGYYGTVMEQLQDNRDNRIGAALLSLPLAMGLNELIWRDKNKKRVRALAQQTLVEKNNADFYCLPNERLTTKRTLFGTKWSYSGEMLAGSYRLKKGEIVAKDPQLLESIKMTDGTNLSTTPNAQGLPANKIPALEATKEQAQDENACYVRFKGQWIRGDLEEVIYTESGVPQYSVSFQYDGKNKSRVFSSAQFSLNDNSLSVGDSVLHGSGETATEARIIELIETSNGRVASIKYLREGEEIIVTVPASMLIKTLD